MKEYIWVYLCNNPTYLELMLSKLPVKRFIGLKGICVITNDRNMHMQLEMKQIAAKYKHNENADNIVFMSDAGILSYAQATLELNKEARVATRWYTLFIKMAIPLMFSVRILFTDDDVICFRDPAELTQLEGLFTSRTHLDQYGDTDEAWDQCDALEEIFGLKTYTPYDYDANHSDAGIWTYDPDPAFPRFLERFWNDPVFNTLHLRKPKAKTFLRTYDQRFYTAYFEHVQALFTSKSRHRRNAVQKLATEIGSNLRWPYPNIAPIWVHYGASTQKPAFVDWFMKNVPDGKDR